MPRRRTPAQVERLMADHPLARVPGEHDQDYLIRRDMRRRAIEAGRPICDRPYHSSKTPGEYYQPLPGGGKEYVENPA